MTASLALFFMLSWAVAPALHAQFETTGAGPAIEQGHSEDCPRIHADTFCLACGGIHLRAPSGADRVPQAAGASILPRPIDERLARPSTPLRDGNAVRAPPIS